MLNFHLQLLNHIINLQAKLLKLSIMVQTHPWLLVRAEAYGHLVWECIRASCKLVLHGQGQRSPEVSETEEGGDSVGHTMCESRGLWCKTCQNPWIPSNEKGIYILLLLMISCGIKNGPVELHEASVWKQSFYTFDPPLKNLDRELR